MDENQLNFNSFVDAYNAYQNPNLPASAPAFTGYGYEAPTMEMMLAPQQMPQMQMNPNAIYDPSVAAAMQILNRPMMIAKTPKMLSDGTEYQRQYGLLKEIAPTKLQQYQKIAPPPLPPSLMQSIGGGGDSGNFDPMNVNFVEFDPFPLGSDAPASLSYEQQNQDLIDAGWSPMGYDDSAPDMSDFGDYSYGSDGSVGGFF